MTNEKSYNSVTGAYDVEIEPDEGIEKSNGPLWPSLESGDTDDEDDDEEFLDSLGEGEPFEKSIQKFIPVFVDVEKAGKDEHIVYGVVYEPNTIDAQGDSASAEEIEKAANYFMEHVQTFKVMHQGKKVKMKVMQSFIAPVDYTIAKRNVKKGSWILISRVNDAKIWKAIKEGKLTGYSMAGYAKVG